MGKNSMKASIAWESFELNIDKKIKWFTFSPMIKLLPVKYTCCGFKLMFLSDII